MAIPKKPNLPPHLKLPFKVDYKLPFTPLQDEVEQKKHQGPDDELIARHEAWLESLKKQAQENVKNDFELIRISWHHRFKTPKYPSFDEYTFEEAVLEAWEQYYFENPDSLELKGIYKKVHQKTKNKYFVTGDPLIDALEREFAEGRTPDLSVLNVANGPDIFREAVFNHNGQPVAARRGFQGVKTNEKGEKITEAGTKIQHEEYKSDEWVKEAIDDDPVLKAMAEKLKKVTDA